MNVRDKAVELVYKLIELNHRHAIENPDIHGMGFEYHKKCALLVCDEILELPFEHQSERAYWESVKQEILKL